MSRYLTKRFKPGARIYSRAAAGIALALWCGFLVRPAVSAELTALRPLNAYHAIDNYNANDIAPALASDENGRMLAVWFNTEQDSVNNGEFTLKCSVSTTSGTTWTDGGQMPLPGATEQPPNLVYMGQGKWLVLVQVQTGVSRTEIHALITDDGGQTWSDPVALPSGHSGNMYSSPPEVASDGAGNVIVIWREDVPNQSQWYGFLTRSTDFGKTWATPQPLTLSSQFGLGRENLAYVGAGKWLILYRVVVGADNGPPYGPLTEFRIAASTDMGANWTEVGPVFSNDVMPAAVTLDFKVAGDEAVIVADLPVFPEGYDPAVVLGGDPPIIGTAVWTSNDSGTTFTGPMWLRGPAPLENGTHNFANPVFVRGDTHGNWIATVKDDPNPLWYSNDISTTWTLSQNLGFYLGLPAVAAAGEENFSVLTSFIQDAGSLFQHDLDLRALVSKTGGQSWNNPTPVNNHASVDASMISDSEVDLAFGDQISLAVWSAHGQVIASRSFDEGDTWAEAAIIPDSFNSYRPRVEWTGGVKFSVYWQEPGLSQTVMETDTVDGGLTWTAPRSVWFYRVFNPLPYTFWHTPLNQTEIQLPNNEKARVRSATVPASATESTVNTYLDISDDNGATWIQRALVHSETRVGTTAQPGVAISGEPAILDLGQGRLAVVISNSWVNIPNEQTPPRRSTWDLFLAESTDNGFTWGNGIPVYSGSDGVQFGGSLYPYALPAVFRVAGDSVIMAWTLAKDFNPNRLNDTDIVYRARQFGVTTAASDWQLFQ